MLPYGAPTRPAYEIGNLLAERDAPSVSDAGVTHSGDPDMTLAMTARITLDRLTGACKQQRVKFQEIFPNGFEATSEAACIAAARKHASDFDWDLAASKLLTGPERKDYISGEASACEVYEDATRPAWEAYEAAELSAMKTYKDATRSEWGAYEAATRQAWKTYKDAKRSAMKAYKSVCADAFARAFWAQETTL